MPLSHDRRVFGLALLAGLPAVVLFTWLLWRTDWTALARGTLLAAVVIFWVATARVAQVRVIRPLQIIANILAGIREGHFTLRARELEAGKDVLGSVRHELNTLSETLKEQRLGALEASALARRLLEEIDVAVFTFDAGGELKLANRAGERLLAQPSERVLGRSASYLGLTPCLAGETPRIVELAVPGTGGGRWELRRRRFRQGGLPLDLVMLTDISRVLRTEERQVWQRLVRVLSHEINNSLAPIKSVAGTLSQLLDREQRPADYEDDLRTGLSVVAARAESLGRFMASYARLAKLPPPVPSAVNITALVHRVVQLETRLEVEIIPGPEITVQADADQLEQVLINLIKNGVEAALETGGGVQVTWRDWNGGAEVLVLDEGPGLGSTTNVFVPFYTTKPSGSGIGLVLSRQVVEAHGGDLTVTNRRDRRGAEARLTLPMGNQAEG